MTTLTRLCFILAFVAMSGPGVPAQTQATGRVMREKLTHSQRILEALMTSDFTLLERESAELQKVTESQAWAVFNSPEYIGHTAAFLRASRDSARPRRRATWTRLIFHYMSLTLSCFQCHRYIKIMRDRETLARSSLPAADRPWSWISSSSVPWFVRGAPRQRGRRGLTRNQARSAEDRRVKH